MGEPSNQLMSSIKIVKGNIFISVNSPILKDSESFVGRGFMRDYTYFDLRVIQGFCA